MTGPAPACDAGPSTLVAARVPPVMVVLDPGDHAAVTHTALAAHAPEKGRITIDPTPGSLAPQPLGADVLQALGKPVEKLAEQKISGITPAWQAAAAWVAGEKIQQVIILRGHRLPRASWGKLLELRAATATRLVIICHRRELPAAAERALADVPHHITEDLVGVLRMLLPAGDEQDNDLAVKVDPAPLPAVPDTEVIRFRADAWRRLPAAEFARVDTLYAAGTSAACRWIAAHPDYRAAHPPPEPVQGVGAHELQRLFPPYQPRATTDAAAGWLQRSYPVELLRPLVDGLLCASMPNRASSSSASSASSPIPWADTDGLELMLATLVSQCPGPRHTLCLLRGAQAGFLLHGLLLSLPAELGSLPGPGMSSPSLTGDEAARIRAGIAHPVIAAALAATLITGASPAELRELPIRGLAPDGSVLDFPATRNASRARKYFVPRPARGILRAARGFLTLRGGDPGSRLLSAGIGHDAALLHAAAESCALLLPAESGAYYEPLPWHRRTSCWWVADPLHRLDAADDLADHHGAERRVAEDLTLWF